MAHLVLWLLVQSLPAFQPSPPPCLVVLPSSSSSLVAYLVLPLNNSSSSRALPPALRQSLLQHLRAQLPASLLPSHVVVLDSLPLTPNLKTDRKARRSTPPSHTATSSSTLDSLNLPPPTAP